MQTIWRTFTMISVGHGFLNMYKRICAPLNLKTGSCAHYPDSTVFHQSTWHRLPNKDSTLLNVANHLAPISSGTIFVGAPLLLRTSNHFLESFCLHTNASPILEDLSQILLEIFKLKHRNLQCLVLASWLGWWAWDLMIQSSNPTRLFN